MRPRIEEGEFNLDALSSGTTLRFYMIAMVALFTVYYTGNELKLMVNNFNPSFGGNTHLGFQMIIFLICLSSVIYWLMPKILIRRYRLTLVPYDQFHDLLTRITELASRLEVPFPTVYFAPIVHRQNAQVFGFGWNPQLRIDKGLALLFVRRTDRFDAVILHELAHIQQGDVFKAYAARALIWATVILTVPVAVTRGYYFFHALLGINYEWVLRVSLTDTTIWVLKNVGIFLLNIGVFIPLICILFIEYARLIRIREHYADWRAGQHGVHETLINVFSQYQQILTSVWKRLIRSHPLPSERASFLQQPLTLGCQISMGDVLLIGIIMVLLSNISGYMAGDLKSAFGINQPEPKDFHDFVQQVKKIGRDSLAYAVVAVIPFVAASTMIAITWSQIIIRYCLGAWLSGRSSIQQIMDLFPILIYSFFGVVLGHFVNPVNLMNLRLANLPESLNLVGLSLELIYIPIFFLISFIYFSFIAPVVVPWMQGEHRPSGLAIISAIMAYFILNYTLGLSVTLQQRETDGGIVLPFLPLLVPIIIWLVMLFLLARFLLKRRRQLGKPGQVPLWVRVKSGSVALTEKPSGSDKLCVR